MKATSAGTISGVSKTISSWELTLAVTASRVQHGVTSAMEG